MPRMIPITQSNVFETNVLSRWEAIVFAVPKAMPTERKSIRYPVSFIPKGGLFDLK
jgi:hypothetical protein